MGSRKLKHNRIRCKKCGDIIESKARHDYKVCSCKSIFVDGGLAYSRRGWPEGDPKDWIEDLCEYEEEPK